jgi:cellulose 1,4-beta-cellobiosidase
VGLLSCCSRSLPGRLASKVLSWTFATSRAASSLLGAGHGGSGSGSGSSSGSGSGSSSSSGSSSGSSSSSSRGGDKKLR